MTAVQKARRIEKIREIIGRVSGATVWETAIARTTVDQTQVDHAFWDRLRNGTAKGYEIVGNIARVITQILAGFVVGSGLKAETLAPDDASEDAVEYTNDLLVRVIDSLRGRIQTLTEDLYGLGNQYVIVNMDGSFSFASPETVKLERNALDYREIIRAVITNRFQDATVTDTYTASDRVVSVRTANEAVASYLQANGWERSGDVWQMTYDNLIGELPIVHFANDRSGNETNGRPIYESLLRVFRRYNTGVERMADGAEMMGNPVPTFEGMENIDETIEFNTEPTSETWVDEDGTLRNQRRIMWSDLPALFIGKGGSFKFSSPGSGFTDDIRNTLSTLFLIIQERVRIPDAIWGFELTSSRSTSVEQIETFYQYIESRRQALAGDGGDVLLGTTPRDGLLRLIDLWLKVRALIDPAVIVAPVKLTWTPLSKADAKLLFDKIKYAGDTGLTTPATTLSLLELVPDAQLEVEAAEEDSAERQADRDAFDNAVNDLEALP